MITLTEVEKRYNAAVCDFIRERLKGHKEQLAPTLYFCLVKTRIGFIELNLN